MNICSKCNNNLTVVDVDFEGIDVYGCEECDFNEPKVFDALEDMKYYM